MPAQIRLGRLFGVEIGLHYSWFVIAVLIVMSLSAHFRQTQPEWSAAVVWSSAVVTGLLFFVAIVLHELSHALVATSRGLPVRSITLFALGGVAQIERDAADAKTEFWMGIAGPLASASIGAACLAVAAALGWHSAASPDSPALAVLVWLGYINLSLALFNMVPGFPLDGGRVLRAAIWWFTGDASRATRIAARVGQVVAFGFIFVGILRFFGGAGLGGLWIAFIGWFLLNAAGATYGQVELTERLRGARVGDVMARDCETVPSWMSVQEFVDEYLLRTGRRCFMVLGSDGRVAGLITSNEVKQVDRSLWPQTAVGQAMRPLGELRTVTPETPLSESLETMTRGDVHQLPVVSGGRLQGVITRGNILHFLRTRAEMNM
jgi:Zn-dependent protease/predicted transcriptional regulator